MQRLVVIADNNMVVHAIRLALRQTAGFQVVGCVDGRAPVRSSLAQLQPDVVLVDDMQRSGDTFSRLSEVAEELPDATSILLTQDMDPEHLETAFQAGAGAVLSRDIHPVALGTLLRELANGRVVQMYRPKRPVEAAAACPLTERELEVLRLVTEGHTNGRIAQQLWVTEQTVKFHLSNTYRKLGVANRTEASHYAHTHDLVEARERLAS